MECLRSLGLNPNIPKAELVSSYSTQSTDFLLNLQQALFEELVSKGLGNVQDKLVGQEISHCLLNFQKTWALCCYVWKITPKFLTLSSKMESIAEAI